MSSDFTSSGSSEEELQDFSAHYDPLHHTLGPDQRLSPLTASFAAQAALGGGASGSVSGRAPPAGAAAAATGPQGASAAPATPAKAEGPAPPGSPLDPVVGPVSGGAAACVCRLRVAAQCHQARGWLDVPSACLAHITCRTRVPRTPRARCRESRWG